MKRLLSTLIGLLVLSSAVPVGLVEPLRAADAITVTTSQFESQFPTQLAFQLQAQSSAPITQIALFVQMGNCVTSRFVPKFTQGANVQTEYDWDLRQNYMPPGSSGQFWWTIQDSAGNKVDSPKQSFRVDDPNHKWQQLSNDQLALYWYSGGQDFGQALYKRGLRAISFLQQDLGVKLDRQVQIFVYGSHSDFMSAESVDTQEWAGGSDFPEYSVVLIDISPSNLEWGLGASAHELTHQVVHRAVTNGCSSMGSLSLPPLMDEGLAVYNQDPGNPDPQFTLPPKRAIQNDTLIPLRTLTSAFPADPDLANLSYGESWSYVDFLIRRYGKAKMGAFLQAVKVGGTIDDLMQQVYGKDLDGMEAEWRQDIGAKPRVVPTRNTSAPTPVPTFGLSTEITPVAPGGESSAVSGRAATATPASVAEIATPAVKATNPPGNAPANPVSNLCGGTLGLVALGLFGFARFKRFV